MKQDEFRLGIRKNIPREDSPALEQAAPPPPLQDFKTQLDKALRNLICPPN